MALEWEVDLNSSFAAWYMFTLGMSGLFKNSLSYFPYLLSSDNNIYILELYD